MSTLWGWRRRRYVYFHAKACFRDYLYAPNLYFANLEAEYFFLQVVLKLKSQTNNVEFGCKHVSKQKQTKSRLLVNRGPLNGEVLARNCHSKRLL